MEKSLEQIILDRIERPGWVSTRGILHFPAGELDPQEHTKAEQAMKELAAKGQVVLWRLVIKDGEEELLAAARPGFELDRELGERGAWAKAVPYEPD